MNYKFREFLKIRRPIVLYPFLLLVLFILTKLRIPEVNPDWSDILIFIILNIALLLLVFMTFNYLIKDRIKAWMIDFLFLFFFLFYYKIKTPISNLTFLNTVLKSVTSDGGHILFILLLIVLVATNIFIIRYRGSLVKLSQYLNLLLSFLIVYQLFSIITQSSKSIKLPNRSDLFTDNQYNRKINSLPDIYYIILDAYTSSQSLKDYWDFENDTLVNFLKDKGFHITENSKTNYNETLYSLASSLNMSYLRYIPHSSISYPQEKNLFDLVDSSYVVNFLTENNYQVINYSFFNIPNAPKYYNDFFFLVKQNLLIGTIYEPIIRKLDKNWVMKQNEGLRSLKNINLDIFNKIKVKNKGNSKPLFIYAHLMMPHDPYLFDENGKFQESDSAINHVFKERYLGQLKFVNKLVINTVGTILDNYQLTPPVIIIQGDHGFRYLKGGSYLKESMTIFNAYYFPDKEYSNIYNSISPVNTFRVLFNKYLDTRFEIMKDTSYNVFY